MAGQWALAGNVIITVAYAGITLAIMVPLVRAGQLFSNRLALATALIFFSCAVGHAFHAAGSWQAATAAGTHHGAASSWSVWPSAVWDVFTAGVGVYYWTLRRGYGVLLGKGALFVDPWEQQRSREIEMREQVAAGRAQAEAERDAHAAMLRAVIGNSQSLIFVKDLDGRYLLANEAFQNAFGVTEADLLGKTDDYLDPELAPQWRAHDLRARDGAFETEEYNDTADGRHVYESVKFPLFDAAGELYATCGVSLDVTRLRDAMADAEHARDEAVAQSQIKTEFLATMSHEIRTPMNGVLGLASLLLGTGLDAAQRRYAAGIHTAGNALLGVINDILDFSKIEAGGLALDPDDFDVAAVLDEVVALVTPAAADKGLTVGIHRGASVPTMVRGDGGRLRQILLNLAGNAVKFTGSGSVTLRAHLVPAASHAGRWLVRFEVADTGAGIAAGDAARLFEPFIQADASTTRRYGGTGLGLAISRQLTEAMGGTIGVDSEPGQGSTFWCVIPFEPARGDTGEQPGNAPDVAGLRVLVVEAGGEQPSLCDELRRWRISATCTHTAAAALHALRETADRGRPYDVLVVDTDTDVDPAAFVRAVRGDPRVPAVHIVVLGADAETRADPAGAGEQSYLPKPVCPSQLFDQLARSMADEPQATSPVTSPALTAGGPHPHDTPDTAPSAPGTGPGPRLLLVEDNEINQLVAVGILNRLGYACDVAGDGLQALELAEANRYDVILMDCQMPRMDGFTATTELRRREGEHRHTTIIAMTASALAADRDRCLAVGMDDYLPKPVTLADLGATLQKWFAAAAPVADAAPAAGPPAGGVDAVHLSAAGLSAVGADGPVAGRLDELAGARSAAELSAVSRLIALFLDHAPRHLAAITDAVAAADPSAVQQQAHSLRGAAANIGAQGLADVCRRLEHRARDGDLSDAGAHLHRLRDELGEADRQLRAVLTGAPHGAVGPGAR